MDAPARAVEAPADPRRPGPGWFRDPREEGDPDEVVGYRWWDGQAWTRWLADSAYAPFPRGETARVVPLPRERRPRPAGWLMLLVGLAAVLLVLTLVAIVGQGLKPALQEVDGPPAMGPAPRLAPAFEQRDRTMVVRGMIEMTTADRFKVQQYPQKMLGVLSECRIVDGEQRPDEKQSAQQIVGNLDPAVLDPDSGTSARRTYEALKSKTNPKVKIQWSEPQVEPYPSLPGASRLRASLRYPGAGPEIVPEQVTMIVVPWQTHGYTGQAMWLSIVPESAPAEVKQSVERSERSIRVV